MKKYENDKSVCESCMKTKICHLFLMLFTFLFLCCNSNSPIIQVKDVREVDFLNKTGDVIKGEFVGEIIGAKDFVLSDSLLIFSTGNPDGQIQVYSVNSLNNIGLFCKKGRAHNEMLNVDISTEQVYKKNGNIILIVYEHPNTIYELDITNSIKSNRTIIENKFENSAISEGDVIVLSNDYNYRLEYNQNIYDGDEIKHVPSKYIVYKDDKKTTCDLFAKQLMAVQNDNHKEFPYMGHLQKHPKHNLVIKKFTHLDYLLFMDLDKNHFYAIHQKGSLTFSDTYMDEAPWALHFTDGAASEKYFMAVYRNGEYAHKTMDGDYHVPEVLIFDWSGKYINGFKLDRFVTNIEYDETKNVLYALDYKEQLYAYDLSELLP